MGAIWKWLTQCKAIQKWSRTLYISSKGFESADDLYVETVLRISEGLPRNNPLSREICRLIDEGRIDEATDRFLAYGYGIFRNVARKHNQQAKKEAIRFSEVFDEDIEPQAIGQWTATIPLENKELLEKVKKAMPSLPDREREVLLGRFFAGLSVADLARQIGCSTNQVRTYESRGLRRLARLLNKQENQ